jgi:hypothetical protein
MRQPGSVGLPPHAGAPVMWSCGEVAVRQTAGIRSAASPKPKEGSLKALQDGWPSGQKLPFWKVRVGCAQQQPQLGSTVARPACPAREMTAAAQRKNVTLSLAANSNLHAQHGKRTWPRTEGW